MIAVVAMSGCRSPAPTALAAAVADAGAAAPCSQMHRAISLWQGQEAAACGGDSTSKHRERGFRNSKGGGANFSREFYSWRAFSCRSGRPARQAV
ncbi:MAG TPA: hypothetical protein VHO06_17950, partial [Polyangia bacterium]|nr:hypothetical protein [Polyangia bacterium]